MRRWLIVTWLVTLTLTLVPDGAEAIPAFARRYQTSCTTCHVLIPKLNAFGIAFRNNGYRIPPNDQKFVKTPDVQLGAPAWKRVWPDAVWPGGIPGMPPVAFRLFSDVVLNPSTTSKVNFIFPNEFEILAVGTAGDHISYLGELEITTTDRVFLARAFIQFDQIFGSPAANLVVGRFEPRAVPFSRFHRRLTPSDFLADEFRNVTNGFDFKTAQAGIEFWGAKTGRNNKGGVEYATGVVNGNGPFTDNNHAKDYYYRLSYKFGGFGVAGSTEETEELKQSNNWRDNAVKIGTFGYFGKGLFDGKQDEFWRAGGDVDIFIRDLNLSTWIYRGRDEFTATNTVTDFTAVSSEANYVVKPWLIGIVRYDAVFRNQAADIKRVVPAVVISIRANVRVVADWEKFFEKSGDTRARVRVDLLF